MALADDPTTARSIAGGLIVCISGGAMMGALVLIRGEIGPLLTMRGWHRRQPESKGRLLLLLLVIGVVGMGAVVVGAFVGGFTGRG